MSVGLVSVVLPVYNQADHIESVLAGHLAALKDFHVGYELLAVVNGVRRDASFEICQAMQARHPEVRALCIDEPGWGRAVRHGIAQARGDLICYTNSARTTADDLLLSLVYGTVHPDAVIKANRKIRASARRRLGSLLYNLEARALFDLPYWDVNGTPKVFSRRHAKLLELASDGDLIDLEFCIACRREGYRVVELPIFSSKRHSGQSTTSFKSAWRMYWGAWRMHARTKRGADAAP